MLLPLCNQGKHWTCRRRHCCIVQRERESGRGQRRAAACSHLSWLRIVLFPFPKIVLCKGKGERRRGVWRGMWADKRSHPSVFNIFHLFYTCYLLAAPASASPCISSPLRLSLSLSLRLCLPPVTVNAAVSSGVAAALLLPHSVDMQLSLTAANLHVLHSQWAAACCCTRCRRWWSWWSCSAWW